MSNIPPENNPSPWQGESASRRPGDAYPDNPYIPPTPEVNDIAPHWTQIQDALKSIVYMNTQIRESTLGVTEALKAQREELQKINSQTSARKQGTRDVAANEAAAAEAIRRAAGDRTIDLNEPLFRGQTAASQQELEHNRNEAIQRELTLRRLQPQITARMSEYQAMTPVEQLTQMRQGNMLSQVGGQEGAVLAGQFTPTEAIQDALSAANPNEDQLTLVQSLNEAFKRNVERQLVNQAPRTIERVLDAVEESGIRQLRYGELTMQDILRSTGTLAGQLATRMMRRQDEQQAALAEQQAAYQAAYAQWQEQAAAAQAAGQQAPPEPTAPQGGGFHIPLPGLLGRAIGAGGQGLGLTGLVGGVARFAPVAGQALALGQIGSGLFNRMFAPIYQAPTRTGQLTGEGWRAGIGARIDAFRLGINPFDLTSMGQAAEMIQAVRERGFTGGQTMDVAEGVRGVVNDLGISINQAADYFTDAMRKGGLSVDEVRKQLSQFDDNAKALNMNINDYTAQILQNTQSFRAMGAGAAAPRLAQAITAGVPTAFRTGEGQQALQQLFSSNRGYITAALNQRGIPANIITVSSQRYIGQGVQELDRLMLQDAQTARTQLGANATWNDIANWMSQAGPHTRGIDPNFLQQYLQSISTGQSVSNKLTVQRAEATYQQRLSSAGTRTIAPSQMTDEQLRALGISRHFYSVGRGQGIQTYTRNGQTINANQPFNNLTSDQIASARRAALAQLAPGTLTAQERKMFEQHIGDRSWDFTKQLEDISRETQRKAGNVANLPGVQISLKPGVESKLFQLQVERRNANNNATLPANQNPTRVVTP